MPRSARTFVPFTAQTRMSGVDLAPATGAPDPQGRGRRDPRATSSRSAARFPAASPTTVDDVARRGSTPLVVARAATATSACSASIELKDIVKGGIKERFAELRRMGIRP